MAYLFDTDAISELLRRKPSATYLRWLGSVSREDQFASAVTVAELYQGAYRSADRDRHLENIDAKVLAAVIILPFDVAVAKVFGRIRADLEAAGTPLDDADLQIAATALYHDLELVTGTLRHVRRVPELRINPILYESKQRK